MSQKSFRVRAMTGGLLAVALMVSSTGLRAEIPMLQVASVQKIDEVMLDGVIEAEQQATVSAQVNARIVELPYDVNDLVEKGAVIVRFRDVEARAARDQATAALQEARARQAETSAELQRIQGVYQRKLISKADLDRAQANAAAADARLAAAQAQLQQSQEALDNTLVRAPYRGILMARHVEVGELANVGQPLLTGRSLEQLRVLVDVPQQFIDSFRHQSQVEVMVPGEGDQTQRIRASKITLFPYADSQNHSFRVRLSLPAGGTELFPGMWTKVAIQTGSSEQLAIPCTALRRQGEVSGVFSMDAQGIWQLRQVVAGLPDAAGQCRIYAGLVAGERIAADAVQAAQARQTQQEPRHD